MNYCFVAEEKCVSIGDISLQLKKPLMPELVPVKYSKHMHLNSLGLSHVVVCFECTLYSVLTSVPQYKTPLGGYI